LKKEKIKNGKKYPDGDGRTAPEVFALWDSAFPVKRAE
jgi:hypothetical protein